MRPTKLHAGDNKGLDMSADISIIAVETPAHRKQFIEFPYTLYKDEPNWRAPLRMERKTQIDPTKNPALKGIEFQLFLAERSGKIVGRVAAILNSKHLEKYDDATGHFGLVDAEDDPEVFAALMGTVENWLKDKGMKRVLGPFNFSINEDLGFPVDGFETPPMLMMPFARPDGQASMEALGYEKDIDLEAYITNIPGSYPHPKIVHAMCDVVTKDPRVTVRHMDMKNFEHEVEMAMEVFNDAWADNWGFLPFSDEQISHIANELKPIIIPEFFWVCEMDGEPAAFGLMVPNINEASVGLNGRLFPFGWIKLLYRLKFKGVKTGRIMLMGVKQEHQKTKLGLAMAATLCAKIFKAGRDRGYENVEMSWILETNKSMIRIIKLSKGYKYKTYRMYQKKI